MDPFTQRMLERARARREKLDTQLSNAGHDVKKRRSPLKDANAILAQATVTKNKSPAKSPSKPETENTSVSKSPRKSNSSKTVSRQKSAGYDSGREVCLPIHRTEDKFNVEDQSDQKPAKKGARLDRLAALASTINNWEDDLSHPTLVKPTGSKAEKIQAKINEQVKNGSSEPQPSTSGCSKWNSNSEKRRDESPTKQLRWDKNVLENLESTEESSTVSSKRCPVHDKTSDNKKTQSNSASQSPANSSKNSELNRSPEKVVKSTPPSGSGSRIVPRFGGFNGSPKSPHQSPGSVLSKASMFESKNTEVKVKDPAQMTLSERMALFERNKGEAPLIPKAPLTMSVPPKKLQEKEKPKSPPTHKTDSYAGNSRSKLDIPNKTVVSQRAMFEGGHTQELENNILRSTHIERQRELDVLRSRFNRNKEMAQAAAGSCIRTSESSEGKSNSPKSSPVCPVKPTPAPENSMPPPPPPPLPHAHNSGQVNNPSQNKGSPVKRQGTNTQQKVQQAQVLSDVKRIRVAAPKPGHLYPNLSEIESSTGTDTDTEYTVDSTEAETATCDEKSESETATEAEYYVENNETELDSDEDTEEVNTSLGRSILRAVNQQALLNKKRSIDPDPDSTTSDISVLDEMDEYLDECLAIQEAHAKNIVREEGPTPPKLNKGGKSPSTATNSIKYTHGSPYRSPVKVVSPTTPKNNEPYVVDGDNCVPLMHTVSFYRRQQSQTPKTPVRVISRTVEVADEVTESTKSVVKDEAELVQEKIKRLLDEVCKQQTIIGQASQALNLCMSTVEFSGSREQVEGERLLLVATHRRQAALNEVQRLKVEGTLKPVSPGSSEVQESGSLTISAITLPLKREFFRSMDTNTCLHFFCLIRHLDEIVATPVVVPETGDSCLRFPSTIKMQDLNSNFKITVEVYSLQTQAEMLPHEIKYHIYNTNGGGGTASASNNKKLAAKTPKKYLKQDSRLVMPSVQSPAGPSAVRTPAFQLAGYVIFSLNEVYRQQFTLNKVPRQSPLEGKLQMHVTCELSVSVEHRGFLTMFEEVSGFGAWHRRWCLLKGTALSYWKYPNDEREKLPIGSLDLQTVCTTNVDLVSPDICSHLNTFLLEVKRPALPGDADSFFMIRSGSDTIIRYFLSADTKKERLEWCANLNKTLSLIRAWGGSSPQS